ncbi:radical SAM protein [Candidatus Parcubacteria bacterium]|nr:radical SAM protein [Candidatus Parcubacteria bacterium]
MRILVLNPAIYAGKTNIMTVRDRQPLDMAYIAALLRADHEVRLLDANIFGYDVDRTLEEIEAFRPDAFVLTSTPVNRWECPNSHIDSVYELINRARIENTILTGSHGSVTPEWMLRKCNVKYVVRGEPEMIVKNLVETIAAGGDPKTVKGISFREGEGFRHTEDAPRVENLDAMPMPAYDLLPMERYRYSFSDLPQPFSIMLTSRGCPYHCTFCLKVMSKDKFIWRSTKSVIDEIQYLQQNFGVRSVYFQDWEFVINKPRVHELCDALIREGIKVRWGCNVRANDFFFKDLIKKMADAGCVRVNIGFESGSQKVLNSIKKAIRIQDLETAIEFTRALGIKLGMYALINAPGETKETIRETMAFLAKHHIDAMNFNLTIPYLGTEMHERLKQLKPQAEVNWDNVEDYAGLVDTELSPVAARFWQRHAKFQIRFGKLYPLNPAFWQHAVKMVAKRLA